MTKVTMVFINLGQSGSKVNKGQKTKFQAETNYQAKIQNKSSPATVTPTEASRDGCII